jgi:enamine deaminase RidA (YjgF/YER057c/UK114 family)
MAVTPQRYEFLPRPAARAEGSGQIARQMIPPAVKVPTKAGTFIYSSMMSGHDDESPTHELPDNVEREAEILFRHIRQFVESAGGKPSDIINLTLYTMDDQYRTVLETQLSKLFAPGTKRPAYHVLNVAPKGLRHERVQAVTTACIPA